PVPAQAYSAAGGSGLQRTITPGRPHGGPPPGISAFRQPSPYTYTDPYGVPRADARGGSQLTSSYEGPALRQTLTGLPQTPMAQSLAAVPDRRPLEHFARPRPRIPWTMLVVALILVAGVLGYRYVTRSGRVLIS